MALKILAQNALDAFSEPDRIDEFVALVARHKPDVAVFPEAYDADRQTTVPAVVKRFTELGYQVTNGDYADADERTDRHGFMVLTRQELVVPKRPAQLVCVAGRNMAEAWVQDPVTKQAVHFIGVHMNDRSEVMRQAELDELLHLADVTKPTVIAGDFNALHRQDARGVVVQSARFIDRLVRLRLVPAPEPVTTAHPKKNVGFYGSLAKRLTDMATGKTMKRLLAAGFTDADSLHSPTFPARKPLVQLDHVMVTPHFTVGSPALLPRNSSDHLGLLAVLNRGQ